MSKDPWFPLISLLLVVLLVWLGVAGPMPEGFSTWLRGWQPLVGSLVAALAVYIAFQNTSRTLRHSQVLESNRRARKHASVRAVLPLALAQVTEYAQRSGRVLDGLLGQCSGQALPRNTTVGIELVPLPSETLKVLAELIEYADGVNVQLVEATVAWIQILDSRLSGIIQDNRQYSSRVIVRFDIEGRIIDAASVYAGAVALFEYARRRENKPPITITWKDVESALKNMGFWDEQYPELHKIVDGRKKFSAGPFEKL